MILFVSVHLKGLCAVIGVLRYSTVIKGAQYTGNAFTGILKAHGVRISMDGKGRATDNIVIEHFWRSLKYEDIYLKDYETVAELNDGLREYFNWYNNSRPHQSLGGRTPAEVYNNGSLRSAA